jgi:hypothetical protein
VIERINGVLSLPHCFREERSFPRASLLCTVMIVVLWLISAAWLREVRYPHSAPIEAQAALGQQ